MGDRVRHAWLIPLILGCSNGFADDAVHVVAQKASVVVALDSFQGIVEVTLTFSNGTVAQTVRPKISIAWTKDLIDELPVIGLDGTTAFEMQAHETKTMTLVGAFALAASSFSTTACGTTVLVEGLPTFVECR